MRVLLLGWGSRGDVEPFVALGLGLKSAGYDVAVAAGRDFAPWIESFGLTCEAFSIDIQEAMRSEAGRAWIGGTSHSPREEMRAMRGVVDSFGHIIVDDLLRMVRPDDLVISSTLTFDTMLAIARARGCRHVTAHFAAGLPTRSGSATLAPVRREGDSLLNLASGYLAVAMVHKVLQNPGRLIRERLGLGPQSFVSYVREGTRVPVLVAASPEVVGATDRTPRVRVTGYWALPTPDPAVLETQVPADLRAFLDAGEPPVYLGFGSATSTDPRATRDLMLDAARRFGGRVLLNLGFDSSGDSGAPIVPEDLRERVFVVGSVPHAWLLPRCAAVVTHGGAGSTAAGLRAGVPSMAVPHMADQPYWGRRLHELGVGPAPIRRCDLTSENLAHALCTMTEDPVMEARARALGARLASEDGVATAVGLINDHLARANAPRTSM